MIVQKSRVDAHWLLTGEGNISRAGGGSAKLRTQEREKPHSGTLEGGTGSATLRTQVGDAEAGYDLEAPPEALARDLRRLAAQLERELQRIPARNRELAAPPVVALVETDKLTPAQLADIRAESEMISVLPILEDRVAAGAPREVWEVRVAGYAFCYADFVPHPASTSCVKISGDSMDPDIPDGSLVGVDHSLRDPRGMMGGRKRKRALIRVEDPPGQIGCAVRNIELVGDALVCTPSNDLPEFPRFVFDLKDPDLDNPISGQVIWRWVSDI